MNARLRAFRLGLYRGWKEFRQEFTQIDNLGFNLVIAAGAAVVLYLQRGSVVEGTGVDRALVTFPGILGMLVAIGGSLGAAGKLAVEREDGTLLRAKALPGGMVGYFTGAVVSVSLTVVRNVLILIAVGLAVVPDLRSTSVSNWLTLVLVLVLGLLATLPWGALIGSLVTSPNTAFGVTMLLIVGLTTISGIFGPVQSLPGWAQALAQVFPVYWLGLGMRAALLPDAAAAAELTGSWRTQWTVLVLGCWALVGLLVSPVVLRRMARRESGSAMQARREQAQNRVG